MRNAARAVDRVPGWKAVGLKLSRLIEEVVLQHEDLLSKVLSGLGRKDQIESVPEQCCELLREKLIHTFGMDQSAVQPGPGGLFPGIVEALTVASCDPDVHIHEWLRGKAPVGITAPIQPGGVFPVISPQSVGKEKDRARYLHAKVWGNANYASYDEHKVQADELFHKEVQKGYVQWAASRDELEREVGTLHLAKIGVIVKGTKMRLIHDLRRNGTNARVTFQERLVLPRLKDLVAGIMDLFQAKHQGEGMDLLTLDFRDAFKQLHVVPTERPFLAGAAMDGFFSYRTILFGVGSGLLVWCRVAAWVMRSTQAWLGNHRAQTNCFVDDPIIAIQGSHLQRRRLAMGVLLWWSSLGLKLAYEKGSFGPDAVWIGTHFLVKPVINKVEICLPAKKNTEILSALEEIMDNSRGMIRHADIRKVAGKESWVAGFLPQLKPFVRQLWASLYKDRSDNKVELVYKKQVWPALAWLRRFHQQHQQDLVRHLFLVDRLLDGLVLEVDASTSGGGAACWIGARQLVQHRPPDAFVTTEWTSEDEELLGTRRGDPAHQATWEAFMVLLAIRHFVVPGVRGRIVLVGDALGVWFGMVKFCARAGKSMKLPKKWPCTWHLWAMSLWVCTFGAKPTRLQMG